MTRRRRVRTPVDRSAAGTPPNRPKSSGRPPTAPVRSGGVSGGPVGRSTAIIGVVALTAIVVVAVALLVSRPNAVGGPGSGSASASAAAGNPSTAASAAGDCPKTQPPALGAGEKRLVTIETGKGTIQLTIEADLGPLAAGNFVALASCGFYDGLVFHRIVPDFVIQGGDPTGTGGGGPGYEFADDPVHTPYARGIVALANSGPNTNGSQFFIVLKDASTLAPSYSVFGRVTSGMEAVDAIAAAADAEKPTNPIAMDKVTVSTP